MKIKMKIKNRSKRYDIVLGLDMDVNIVDIDISVIMLACIKQRLSNIWSSIHENVKQAWGWVEKKRYL